MSLAFILITLAILFSVFRALTPFAEQYKGKLETHLSIMLGKPVAIDSMETSWYWFEPVLKLNKLTIVGSNHPALHLKELFVGINILQSLWHWQIQPGVLFIEDLDLNIHQEQDKWRIEGLESGTQRNTFDDQTRYYHYIGWLLAQQKILVKNLSAQFYLKDGTVLPFEHVDLRVINHSGHYRIKGSAELAQTIPTKLSILANMEMDPDALNRMRGHVYIDVQRFLPAQWQALLPKSTVRLEGGLGDFSIWGDFEKGQLSHAQGTVDFKHIGWNQSGKPQSYFIQELKGNLAWDLEANGWQLNADKIKLRMAGRAWAENTLRVHYDQPNDAYRVFIEKLQLKPLLGADIRWPQPLWPLLELQPYGELNHTQVMIQDKQVNYFLTRFEQLGWIGTEHLPAVDNLSGVLHWQPQEGHLQLDAEHATISPQKLPPVIFEQVNAAFNWKTLSHATRISMERFLVTRDDLTLNAHGVLDKSANSLNDRIRMKAHFSARDFEQWFAYLPSEHLKPKLDSWLKENIKHINKASGEIKLNGLLNDFPFDERPGEFLVNAYLSGIDVHATKEWPLTKNMDVSLTFDKRDMNVDVHHAELQGVTVDNINMAIHEVGLDRETLLMHGKLEASSDKLLDYLFTTPLHKKLAKLKMVDLSGPLDLDLRMEIPLYPENDTVLAQGKIAFKDNLATIHHSLDEVELKQLTGNLVFDEHGITDSAMTANILGDPVSIHMESVRNKHPYTEVRVKGNTTIDLLKGKFKLPALSLMHGHLNLESVITITDDPDDLDHIHISTPLRGVAVYLPPPLGKSFDSKAPLTVDIDFNPNKALHVHFNYDDRLSSNLWYIRPEANFILDKGTIRVGSGSALKPKNQGIQILGTLSEFDLRQWQDVVARIPSEPSSEGLSRHIHFVDLKVGAVKLWNQTYKNTLIRASKLKQDKWSLVFEQQDLSAKLNYQPSKHHLSGFIKHLNIDNSMFVSKASSTDVTDIQPTDIPNLDLNIENLQVNDFNLGQVQLKSSSKRNQWHLEKATIHSDAYHLVMAGHWNKTNKENHTDLNVHLHISNLARSLQKFKIPPVVEAQEGEVEFNGSWPNAIYDFSLLDLSGGLNITLKRGRITSLSPETEQKLGLGKLLSILSLQTIPRRLQLDFSDLSKAGYSFDVFKGQFNLKKGVLTTHDSYIDGPVAYASMDGSLNVVKQLYDLNLQVAPHVTASLPVVATIAGGPIAGIATWVVSKLITHSMKKVSGYTFKISGPWMDPVVQQVSITSKKEH